MSEPIDPPAAETAQKARQRYDALCQRLKTQAQTRQTLRSDYTEKYVAEIALIMAIKKKLSYEKKG